MDTDKLSRIELVPLLVDAGISWSEKYGREERLQGLPGPVIIVDRKPLSLILRTPKSMATMYGSSNYGLDIWFEDKKVLAVEWNSKLLKDYEIVRLKKGPWIKALLSANDTETSG